jgi:hypothetical protein
MNICHPVACGLTADELHVDVNDKTLLVDIIIGLPSCFGNSYWSGGINPAGLFMSAPHNLVLRTIHAAEKDSLTTYCEEPSDK